MHVHINLFGNFHHAENYTLHACSHVQNFKPSLTVYIVSISTRTCSCHIPHVPTCGYKQWAATVYAGILCGTIAAHVLQDKHIWPTKFMHAGC